MLQWDAFKKRSDRTEIIQWSLFLTLIQEEFIIVDGKRGEAEIRPSKRAGFVYELDSQRKALIVWFSLHVREHSHFWGSHVEITPACAARRLSKNWSWAKLTSWVPKKTKRALTQRKPNAFRETDVWVEDLKMAFHRLFFLYFFYLLPELKRVHDNSHFEFWKEAAALQHCFSFTQRASTHVQKSGNATASPHKGNTNPLCSHIRMQATPVTQKKIKVPKICNNRHTQRLYWNRFMKGWGLFYSWQFLVSYSLYEAVAQTNKKINPR